jgi:hypothetical protein
MVQNSKEGRRESITWDYGRTAMPPQGGFPNVGLKTPGAAFSDRNNFILLSVAGQDSLRKEN